MGYKTDRRQQAPSAFVYRRQKKKQTGIRGKYTLTTIRKRDRSWRKKTIRTSQYDHLIYVEFLLAESSTARSTSASYICSMTLEISEGTVVGMVSSLVTVFDAEDVVVDVDVVVVGVGVGVVVGVVEVVGGVHVVVGCAVVVGGVHVEVGVHTGVVVTGVHTGVVDVGWSPPPPPLPPLNHQVP